MSTVKRVHSSPREEKSKSRKKISTVIQNILTEGMCYKLGQAQELNMVLIKQI
jgi:hypothetical protein